MHAKPHTSSESPASSIRSLAKTNDHLASYTRAYKQHIPSKSCADCLVSPTNSNRKSQTIVMKRPKNRELASSSLHCDFPSLLRGGEHLPLFQRPHQSDFPLGLPQISKRSHSVRLELLRHIVLRLRVWTRKGSLASQTRKNRANVGCGSQAK